MNIKERFTVYRGPYNNVGGVMDHLTEKFLTEEEFENIAYKEYGGYISLKYKVMQQIFDSAQQMIKTYNNSVEESFEITNLEIARKLTENDRSKN